MPKNLSRLRGIVAENSQQRQTTELFAAQQAQTATLLPLLQQIINNTTKRPPAPRRLPNRQFRLPAFYRAGAFLNPGALPPLNIKPERRIDDNVRKYDARNAGRKSRSRRRYGNASHVSRHAGHGFRHALLRRRCRLILSGISKKRWSECSKNRLRKWKPPY